jgi:hypothetical protein
MGKTKTLNRLANDVAVALQKHVRLKAANSNGFVTCITCGLQRHWKESDGAHYISRTHQATKCMEENIHPSCKRCNMLNDVFVQEAYTAFMVDMYGQEFVDEIKALARKPFKHDRISLEAQLKDLKARNKELEDAL